VYGPIVGGDGDIFGKIVMSPRAASCMRFVEVPGIAVDGQDHVTLAVSEDGRLLSGM
jgi:hypothetical protein